MDGVLIDTEKYLTRFWRQAAAEAGLLLSLEECYAFRSFAGKYAAPWFAEKYGEQYDYWTIRERRKELMQEHIRVHGIEKKDGVEEVLQVLSQEGYQTAVVTATDETRARQYLRDIGILELFDAVICANMVERGKPFLDVYLYACEKIQKEPQDCVAVEDSPNGIRAAYGAGCHVVMVPDLTQPDEESQNRIERKAASIRDIPGVVREISRGKLQYGR